MSLQTKILFRVIDPRYGRGNVYDFAASRTISLGPVMIATIASQQCGRWLEAEATSENNCHKKRGAPLDAAGLLDHFALQQERYAAAVSFSCGISNAVPRALELIKTYREMPEALRPKAIIVGGWHPTDLPEDFLAAGADVVVHGEGDEVIGPVLEALLHEPRNLGNIPGISYWDKGQIKRNGTTDLCVSEAVMENLPHPNFGLVRYARIKVFPVQTSRGCGGRCGFCRVRTPPRSLSARRAAEQIIVTITTYGARQLFVVDDHPEEKLRVYCDWLERLKQFLRERKLVVSIMTQNRLSLAEKPEVLKLMRQAGIDSAAIGFETPDPILLRSMRKPIKPEMMIKWAKTWKQTGFYVHAMFILGYPLNDETKKWLAARGINYQPSAKKLGHLYWWFINKIRPNSIQILLFTPLPGTVDRKRLAAEGRVLLDKGWEFYTGHELLFVPDAGIDPVELQQVMVRLMSRFYAFNVVWLSTLTHWLKIGAITIAMPIFWSTSLKPWRKGQPWQRLWWNSIVRYIGFRIVHLWRRKHRQLLIQK